MSEEVSDADMPRPVHLAQAIPPSMLSPVLNPYLAGFTQPGEHMRCPFLSHSSYDCSGRLYHSIRDLELHLHDVHGVGLHAIAEVV